MRKKNQSDRISPITDNLLRNPGQSLDEELQRRWEEDIFESGGTLVCIFVLLVYEWFQWLFKINPHPLLLTLGFTPWIIFSVFKISKSKQLRRRLKMARDGEKAIGQYLSDLREQGHRVYHDVIGKNFNIDHVIVAIAAFIPSKLKPTASPHQDGLR